ncbi:phage tail protein I [Selenomonas sp. F0473]|uniref:phage tail protein I n=1 Tax=Selenomonas sp. F0473 TaxID=999423 RepID=UPI0025F66386|nr:phage tail protein I [Selenomonas sp. F0473]
MANQLHDTRLCDIMPVNITEIAEAHNAAAAIDIQNVRTADDTERLAIIAGIDTMPESIIDLLAWQWRVDFYDASANLAVKRKQVKTSIAMHRIKGTKRAVVMALRMIYDSGNAEEWFTYGGKPYRFRVQGIRSRVVNIEEVEKLNYLITAVKNARSWLESINFLRKLQSSIYSGAVVSTHRSYQINPAYNKDTVTHAGTYAGGVVSTYKEVVING